jgi:hypothetical protein
MSSRGRRPGVRDEFGHVEADAARPHDRHALADRLAAQDHVDVAHHLGVVDASIGRRGAMPVATTTSSKPPACSMAASTRVPSRSVDAVHVDHPAVVAQRLVELLLAGDALGQVELPADLWCAVEQRHRVAALRRHRRIGQPGRPGAHHGEPLGAGRRPVVQQRLVAGARVDQAAHLL